MVLCGLGTKVGLSQFPTPRAPRISNRHIPRLETHLTLAESTSASLLIATKPHFVNPDFSSYISDFRLGSANFGTHDAAQLQKVGESRRMSRSETRSAEELSPRPASPTLWFEQSPWRPLSRSAHRGRNQNLARPEGFEPPTLCLEGRLLTSCKQFIFNRSKENLGLNFAGRMCPGVCKCGCLHVESLQKSLQSRVTGSGATA